MNNSVDYERFLTDKCTRIKFLVQQFSGVPDIGMKSRKRIVSDMKKVYCKICKEKTKASLATIGRALNGTYDHASVLHSIKEFNKLYETNQLTSPEVYEQVIEALDEIKELEVKEESTNKKIKELCAFLDWFRTEIGDDTPIETSFFVGKYFGGAANI
ncbi:MAG: helix-turn-helix domain-containing protein [Acidobacteriota bacterium]|jgi:hypothetical protein